MKKEFQVHKLNESGMAAAKTLAEGFSKLLDQVEEQCQGGDGRCLAIVRTKLEEACFFAKKSLASAPGNQAAE
jgi:hypothetical protein